MVARNMHCAVGYCASLVLPVPVFQCLSKLAGSEGKVRLDTTPTKTTRTVMLTQP